MARSRNIKPSFFTNDLLAECSLAARLLFIGLWTIADREGRLEDRPKKIKAEALPYDDFDCDVLLNELSAREFIIRYSSNNTLYIQVVNFNKHQNPHMKENESTIPAPDKSGTSTKLAPNHPGLNLLTDSLNPITSNASPDILLFHDFWKEFPKQRRGSKDKAMSAWKSAIKRAVPQDIFASVLCYAKSDEVIKGFAKGAAAWLNDDRWTTNYSFTKPKSKVDLQAEENMKLHKEIMGIK